MNLNKILFGENRLLKKQIPIKKINLYIIGICIINIVQAVLTPITNDEAYYWVFSKNLDLGYFDHPPMVAYIIKLSSYLFSNTLLGVRFITIVLLGFTLKIIWKLIPEENKEHKYSELMFILLVLAIPIFNIYGFITTPDAPFLFAAALFLLALERMSKKESFTNILILGIASALLIYSKYHGGIVIILAVFLKFKLLKKWGIYISGILALLLILPHLNWQYQNDFITFDYHLFQRTSGEFSFKNVIHYVLSTVAILNPALIIVFFYYLKKQKLFTDRNNFMTQIFIGFLAFFLIYSFRSKIEAHWVAFSAIPMVILIYNLMISHNYIRKQMKLIGILSIVLIFSARLLIVLDLPLKTEFHIEKKDYFEAIFKKANGKNVVFVNSYQKAAKYSFYTGEASFSDNNAYYRKNQYDLLNAEAIFNDTPVLFIGNWPHKMFDSLKIGSNEIILHHKIDKYPIFNKLEASINNDNFKILNKKGRVDLTIKNPYDYMIDLEQKNLPYKFSFCLKKGNEIYFAPLKMDGTKQLKPGRNNMIAVGWELKDKILNGPYKLQIVLQAGYLNPKVLSKKYDIEVKK
ncbi:glycosyltransferase family 39 protein [Algibacter sp. 2305UL17-15]|uniref:ArnT family glycosyltransferase n=1 Tax=Algibacter sp. 2305UL17-15 TaxID=3231268 RepID=UPI003458C1E6